MMTNEPRFAFGKNWTKYLKDNYNEALLEKSKKSLADFLDGRTLEGKSFLDFGCGSGVHSLAALSMGAAKVLSIDFDQYSVDCTKQLKEKVSHKYNWEVMQGSLLDDNLIEQIGEFDVVYCWGVAHHTGNMNKALENLSRAVSSKGLLFLAIYNKTEGLFGSRYWWRVKHFYNRSGLVIKKIMEALYVAFNFTKLVVHLKNPLVVARDYKLKRGMSRSTDLIDWLGGFPYEYASVKEIFDFLLKKHHMELVNIKTTNYTGCNQFLFYNK